MQLTQIDVLIRLSLGLLAGVAIGLKLSSQYQVAGLRTHILIATGATLLMLLFIWLPQEFKSMKNGDPGRLPPRWYPVMDVDQGTGRTS